MLKALKCICCMMSVAVFAEGLHHIRRRPVPMNLITNKSSKTIHLLGNKKSYDDSKSDINDQTTRFYSTVNSKASSSLKNRHNDLFKNLENPIENAKRESLYFTDINQMEKFAHLKDSQIHSNKMNNLKQISSRFNHSKLAPNDLKDRSNLFLSAPTHFHDSYYPENSLPISYYMGPQKHSITRTERSTEGRGPQRRPLNSDTSVQPQKGDYMPLEHVQWHGKAFIPHYANNYHSKLYLDGQFPSDRQFRIDYKELSEKSLSEFNEHAPTKPNYILAKNIHQPSSRLQSFQSDLFSDEDNDSQNSDSSSSKEFNQGSYQSFHNHKSPQTKFKTELPKNSYFNLEKDVDHFRPLIHLSPSFGKPRNSDSQFHEKQKFHHQSPHHSSPHQTDFAAPSKRPAISTNSNNQLTERSALNPIRPSFGSSHQNHFQNSYLGNPQHFNPEESREGTLFQFSGSTELSSDHRPFSSEYIPLDLKGPHYQEKLHDSIFNSDKENLQSYLPNHEYQQSSESSNGSEENVYVPRQIHMENDKIKKYVPDYNNKKYSIEEEILAARVKELLNPSGIPVEEDSKHSANNFSSQNHQTHSSPIINHHISDIDSRRQNHIRNSTVSGRDADIVGLGSDPEPDSEPESEDNKDGVSEEEEHDGFLDMGAYTDKQGSFGWYADFPVGRGHDKVSYSSS